MSKIKEMMIKSIDMALGSTWIEFRMHGEVKEFLEEDIVQLLSMTGYKGSYDVAKKYLQSEVVLWENGKSEMI